ncbi:proline iminopeptidase-family hydrolase [soil metagenome]
MATHSSGFVDVGSGRIWYERSGDGPALLLLHGGPGADSHSLKDIMRAAEWGFTVVRFDQLGSRNSDKPGDTSLWTVQRFVEEVETVRRELDLGMMHLLGQSWGAFLALEYALHFQQNLLSLFLYSGAASTLQCVDGMNRLKNALPPESVAILNTHESAGTTSDPEYLQVIDVLLRRHLCRVDPWPPELKMSMDSISLPVYRTMWGPNEFTCTGTLQSWDRRNRLHEVTVPTQILCGRHDEVIPECSETMHAGIPNSELVIFEDSSHHAHFEEPVAFFELLKTHLINHTPPPGRRPAMTQEPENSSI